MPKFSEGKGAIYHETVEITVGALAAGDAIAAATRQDGSRNNGFRFLKSEYFIAVENLSDDEALLVGIGGPTLSAASIEEAIEADPQGSNDPSGPTAMRPVWPLEMFMAHNGGNGKMVAQGEWKPRWSFSEEDAMNVFAYNVDQSNPLTTGARVMIYLKHYGVWLND